MAKIHNRRDAPRTPKRRKNVNAVPSTTQQEILFCWQYPHDQQRQIDHDDRDNRCFVNTYTNKTGGKNALPFPRVSCFLFPFFCLYSLVFFFSSFFLLSLTLFWLFVFVQEIYTHTENFDVNPSELRPQFTDAWAECTNFRWVLVGGRLTLIE